MNYKERAKEKLRGKWGTSIGVVVIYSILSGLASAFDEHSVILTILLQLLVVLIAVGYSIYFLKLTRQEEDITDIFIGYKDLNKGLGYLGVALLTGIIVMLGYILLIVPGVIMSYSFRYALLIKYDNPEMGVWEAMQESRAIMQGRKMDAFILDLSFIGWYILGMLAFIVGILPVTVYHQTASTEFYEKAREDYYGVKRVEGYRYMEEPYKDEENAEVEYTAEYKEEETVTTKDTDSNLY